MTVDMFVDASCAFVWDVIRDVHAADTRLIPGLVTGVAEIPGARVVTFANGLVVTERIVTLDDATRTLVYQAINGPIEDHLGIQVVTEDELGRTRLRWTTQFSPAQAVEAACSSIGPLARLMKKTIERAYSDTVDESTPIM